jgi:DNA modification methylase
MKAENNNKQMKDVWLMPLPSKTEKAEGKHPTQKPIGLLSRIITASTKEGDLILDPFNGSGTTGLAAIALNRKYLGIESEEEFISLTEKRYKSQLHKGFS